MGRSVGSLGHQDWILSYERGSKPVVGDLDSRLISKCLRDR